MSLIKKLVNRVIEKLDRIVSRRTWIGFVHAVLKKYNNDQVGYQAALLTYYAFWAVFPLLLVVTTLASMLPGHPAVQNDLIKSATSNFPVLGDQLAHHIHSLHKNGVALVVGILFVLYGALGVSGAFRKGVNLVWGTPRKLMHGFPASLGMDIVLLLTGAIGLTLASVCSGLALTAGHDLVFRLLALGINVVVLFWLFIFLLSFSLPRHITIHQVRGAALAAAIGLGLLQAFGTYVISRELKNLDALYSYFALALGLFFWVYLQAQVVYFAIVSAAVRQLDLWPRSIKD